MTNTAENNKRIAKNVSYLYFRMIFLLLIGLYTSRVVLNALGVTDFGIYNVVGGIVAMFSFINGSISTATTRFLTYELGQSSNRKRLRLVFSTALLIHIGICVLLVILFETIGLWYIYNVLVVPTERFTAALFVYQFSVLTALINIISVPYNATIIAHEKMGAFAYISIFEALASLSVALIVSYTTTDKLIVYGILLMIIQIILRIIYGIYCAKHFSETKGEWMFDKKKFKEMGKFSLWIMNGAIALMGYTQGLNLLLNFFFGPTVNAARGIAVTVQGKVMQFCNNFQMAINPQITKNYASGNYKYMHELIYNASKYSILLMFLLSFPIMIEAEYILKLWLGIVPEYTIIFVQLTLVIGIVDALRMPMNTSIHATGNIKKFQIYEGGVSLLILPIAYIILKMGMPPVSVFIVQLIMFILIQYIRVLIVCPTIHMLKIEYFKRVIIDSIKIILPVVVFIYLIKVYISFHNDFIEFLVLGCLSTVSTLYFTYIWGIDSNMRKKINQKLQSRFKH